MENQEKNQEIRTNQEIMEEFNEYDAPIGTKEPTKLKEGIVKVKQVSIEEVKNKENQVVGKKVVCMCKHQDKDELITISNVKHQMGDILKETALWLNKDEDGLIAKNSALASLLRKVGALNVNQLKDKEIDTMKDSKGYLTFKGY